MAGKSEYDRKTVSKKEKKPIKFEDIKGKFGKEPMSAEEWAVYLSGIKKIENGGFTDKTVRNYIKAICAKSDGVLEVNAFKRNPKKSGSKYEFKPQYHSLLLTLMASDCFDERKNDRRLSTRAELYGQLVDNINKYLEEFDKKLIKSDPTYVNAILESCLTEHINIELTSLIRSMYHSVPVLRYQLMVEFLSNLHRLREWMDRLDSKAMSARMIYAHNLDELQDAKYQKGLFESNGLDEFIIKYLALKMNNKKYEYISDDEELLPVSMCLATKLFNITIKDDTDIKKIIDEIDASIVDEKRYKEIMEKAESILNLENPMEAKIYRELQEMTAIQCLRPYVSSEDYERTVRFVESCITDDKWDIINKFLQIGCRHMTNDEIDEIIAIKDRSKE